MSCKITHPIFYNNFFFFYSSTPSRSLTAHVRKDPLSTASVKEGNNNFFFSFFLFSLSRSLARSLAEVRRKEKKNGRQAWVQTRSLTFADNVRQASVHTLRFVEIIVVPAFDHRCCCDRSAFVSCLVIIINPIFFKTLASTMEMAPITSSPRTVEEIFKDYSGRRAGIVRALTYDVDEFYALCDPEKENLCLYGHPNESWEVTLPAEEVPPELPEPALGINFARDGMNRRDWLSLVAVHSDSWLLSVAFYLGARFNRNERKRLFSLINDLPTVYEVVAERKPVKDKPSVDSGSKSRLSTKRSSDGLIKNNSKPADEPYGEDDDEHSETLCGSCGGNYNADEFWIGCDICEKWYHGKCVKITPAKAENIKQYKCPSCSGMKRGRP